MSRIFVYLLCFLAAMIGQARGCETQATQVVARTILALYDGRREDIPANTRLHRFLELPLNHLGYGLRFLDISREDLPDPVDPKIAGAVAWFDAPLHDPDGFATWAVGARSDCPDAFSFIVLGETGLQPNRKPRAADALYLKRLGLDWTARSTLLGDFTEVKNHNFRQPGYESDFVVRPGRYASLRAVSPADAALTVVPAGKTDAEGIDLVVQHHPNAYVQQSATLDADGRSAGYFWVMDPFAILSRALSRGRSVPVADVTTLNGRRLYFETVGPEGWLAPAPARTFDEEPRLGSENLLSTLIVPFPDIPVTVSVVTGDLESSIGGKSAEIGRDMAGVIFSLPQTAIATSGRSLVRRWAAMSETHGTAEIASGEDDKLALDQPNPLLAILGRNLREAFAAPNAPAEPQLSDGLRQYGQDPFRVDAEIGDAIDAARGLAPNKAMPPLFLWSGDGKPAQDVRAAVVKAGSPALGGGAIALSDSVSLTAMSAFYLSDGAQLQVYHALPGDLGNLGYPLKDVHALQGLALLVSQTDRPLRLKPFQLAYSAGSANQFSTRSIIERLKQSAVSEGTIPIFASQYVKIVEGFSSVGFNPEGELKWRVTDRGGLQTIRFDDADALSLDLAESEGALGARRINGSLYVALDPGVAAPLVKLSHDTTATGMVVPVGRIGLLESNLEVLFADVETCLAVFEVTGWGKGEIGIYGDPGAHYRVKVGLGPRQSTGTRIEESDAVADASGYAKIAVPTRRGSVQTVTLRQNCAG